MDIEALVVVGAAALGFGAILLVPGIWWARRRSKRLPRKALYREAVTPFGLVFFAVFVGLLGFALSLEHLAPEISGAKRLALIGLIFLVGFVAERLAGKLGLKLFSEGEDSDE